MINLTNASLKIYLALQPCDMRKSFNGLAEIATEHLGQELVKEAIFAFVNKRRNRLKLLYFDGTGLWVASNASKKELSAGPPATMPATRNSSSLHRPCNFSSMASISRELQCAAGIKSSSSRTSHRKNKVFAKKGSGFGCNTTDTGACLI